MCELSSMLWYFVVLTVLRQISFSVSPSADGFCRVGIAHQRCPGMPRVVGDAHPTTAGNVHFSIGKNLFDGVLSRGRE